MFFTIHTKINQGVILMCTKDNYFQKFVIREAEFNRYVWQWLRRVSDYYENKAS